MAETGQRGRITKALRSLHAVSVENPVKPGTPDVNYVDGWIELKWLRRWPVRPETVVKIDHYTKVQRSFGRMRWRARGKSFLLLQVQTHWLLFTGPVAAKFVGKVDRATLNQLALRHWAKGLNRKELIECLMLPWETLNASQTERPCSLADDV